MNLYKREHLRRWGFLRSFYAYCLLKLHRFFGFRLVQIRARELRDNGIECLDERGLLMRRATRAEIIAACADPRLDLELDVVEPALARGDACFGAFRRERLVGYSWCGLQATPLDERLWIEVPAHAVYRYKSFVLPDCRGRRVLSGLNRLTDRPFIEAGKSICLSYVESHNFAMLRASKRAGYRRVGLVALTEHPYRFRCWRSPGARRAGVAIVARPPPPAADGRPAAGPPR